MKKIFIGVLLFTVFLYVVMTDQVWSVMEAWQRALWILFIFLGQFSLFIIPFLHFSGYRPRNLKKEISDLKVNYVTEQLKNQLLIRNIRNLRSTNALYRNYIQEDIDRYID